MNDLTMDTNFTVAPANMFAYPESGDLCYKNDFQVLDYNDLTGFDNPSYTMNADLNMNTKMNYVNLSMNEAMNSGLNTASGLNGGVNTVANANGWAADCSTNFFENYNAACFTPGPYYANNGQAEVMQLNLGDLRSVDQFTKFDQHSNQQYGAQNMAETALIEPGIVIGDLSSEKSSNSQNYSGQSNYKYEPYNAYQCYAYTPLGQDANAPMANFAYGTEVKDSKYAQQNLENSPNKEGLKDELESVANASTCDNTPLLRPSSPNYYLNALSSNYPQNSNTNNAFNSALVNGFNEMNSTLTSGYVDMNNTLTNGYTDMSSTMSNGYADMNGMTNGYSDMNATMNGGMNTTLNGAVNGANVEGFVQDMSDTQLVNGGFYYPGYYQYYYTPTMNGYNSEGGYEGALEDGYDDGLNESIVEIANEIANNVQYLPDKDSNGKYSLDKNHPIHCVWRDVNRGHCSWRCRWWENGKRLSKNFNVKRFGDFEAMRMAITMKIRNSTPVERIQLLKEQREAVRNQMQLYSYYPSNYNFGYLAGVSDVKITKVMNNSKKLQRENWSRLSWTYLKTSKMDKSADSTIICRLCSKTTRCSRSRNLQQAHIMHLIRMHKNPWRQYIDPNGLTKMCKLALDALYEQNQFSDDQEWNLRPGVHRPEPYFV
ncbi:conserved hypothetical protein [Theileria orientalis strain Shintoku]|uniref:Uncharacterized protein n=1 Tax=Theileria orientalis strain Shintoku TaxID=869250 RepID=J4C860_THEOR|nr:conserved hypothetical protein [Theileria orientalis strain Shintoku]BAM40223.1 conserved hypothetical protein [Theileria orientalis strain Shintoku]|eukprot:XP_009690524.1 conserved hypothetical protein [Theileria orientalis strain Shintoku]